MASWVSTLLCGKAEVWGESVGKQVRGLEYAGAFVWSLIVQEREKHVNLGLFTRRGLSAYSQQSKLSESWCVMTHAGLEKVSSLVEAKVKTETGYQVGNEIGAWETLHIPAPPGHLLQYVSCLIKV